MKFKIGDKVVKDPDGWEPSEFDGWGSGEGVGIIVPSPFPEDADDGIVDVQWPTGRCFQKETELLPAPKQP